jgi:uncharacterized protein
VDPRSPLVLNTHDLGRRPGAMRQVRAVVPAPEDLGTALVGVEAGSDLELDLRLEAVMEGVLVTGTVRGVVTGECGRCLGPLEKDLAVELQELFVHPGHDVPEEEDDLPELQGEDLDLEPALRDAVVTGLPFQPLCREDCPGLCPRCGIRLADVAGEHIHEEVDPRWAALQGLLDEPPRAAGGR